MQLCHGLILPLLQKNIFFCGGTLRLLTNVFEPKPRLKDGQIIKDGRVDKVKQTPQLIEVVLDRGTGQQETIGRFDSLETANECAAVVFETLSLINYLLEQDEKQHVERLMSMNNPN